MRVRLRISMSSIHVKALDLLDFQDRKLLSRFDSFDFAISRTMQNEMKKSTE